MADLAEDSGKLEALAGILGRLLAPRASPSRQVALALRQADALARSGRGDDSEALLDEIVAARPVICR